MARVASTVVRILPRHLRELTQPADIRAVHETLVGTPALLANVAFLEILKQWPLFGAIQFEVSVSWSIDCELLWFYVPLDTKWVVSETLPQASLFARVETTSAVAELLVSKSQVGRLVNMEIHYTSDVVNS